MQRRSNTIENTDNFLNGQYISVNANSKISESLRKVDEVSVVLLLRPKMPMKSTASTSKVITMNENIKLYRTVP